MVPTHHKHSSPGVHANRDATTHDTDRPPCGCPAVDAAMCGASQGSDGPCLCGCHVPAPPPAVELALAELGRARSAWLDARDDDAAWNRYVAASEALAVARRATDERHDVTEAPATPRVPSLVATSVRLCLEETHRLRCGPASSDEVAR